MKPIYYTFVTIIRLLFHEIEFLNLEMLELGSQPFLPTIEAHTPILKQHRRRVWINGGSQILKVCDAIDLIRTLTNFMSLARGWRILVMMARWKLLFSLCNLPFYLFLSFTCFIYLMLFHINLPYLYDVP